MSRKFLRASLNALAVFWVVVCSPSVQAAEEPDAGDLFHDLVTRVLDLIEPPDGAPARTFETKLKVVRAMGIAREATGATAEIAFQSPDRLLARVQADAMPIEAARDGQQNLGSRAVTQIRGAGQGRDIAVQGR